MPPKLTPGARLRRAMNDALQAAAEDAGYELTFEPAEARALEIACDAADRAGELQQAFDAELIGQARPATLAKLSSELRGLEKQQLDAIAKFQFDPDHLTRVRRSAARGRWGVNGVRHGRA